MPAPLFITTEKKHSVLPMLVVDKSGTLSRGLISLLSEHFTVVTVSEKHIFPHLPRVHHVSFRRKVPAIPDDVYSGLIVFYNGEPAIRDGLPSFLKKAKQNNAKLLLITAQEHAGSPFLKKAIADYEEAHLLIYGMIFGISAHEISVVTHMLHEAGRTGKISVRGSGLSEYYPIYYPDMLQGILHILLSHGGAKTGLLYPKTPVSEMHLARLITKIFPHASIMFIGDDREVKHDTMLPAGDVLIEEPYPLLEKLRQVASFVQVPGVKLRAIPRGKRKRLNLLPYAVAIAIVLLLLPSVTFLFSLFGMLSLKVALGAGRQGNVGLVSARAQNAKDLFTLAKVTALPVVILSQPVGLGELGKTYERQLSTAAMAADVVYELAEAGKSGKALTVGEKTAARDAMLAVSYHLKQAVLGLSAIRAANALPDSYKKELLSLEPVITRVSGLIDSLPYLAGVGKEQTYLVLFQNNMELRPGGGFIGSYGILRLKDGTMREFSVHNVYDADGQLKGHIEPPFGLKRYLGASHLFLRDSNFSPEFADNAALAAQLLQLSINERVDGVITMDVSLLRSLLMVVGPLYLPAYNETVSADTFYLSAQKHAEANFFPGSTQKQDFLQYVAQALVLSLKERRQLPYLSFLLLLDRAVSEKHLQIASGNPGLMRTLTENGFAPTVRVSPEEKRADLADSIGWFEANVGTNKANYYVKRSFGQSVRLHADGAREGTMTVTYTNSSSKSSPFGGDYKNFIQVLLPLGSEIVDISVDGVPQTIIPAVTSSRVYTDETFIPPAGLEVDQSVAYGRSLSGFLVIVPAGEHRRLAVSYRSPAPAVLPVHVTTVLRVIKQPGTDHDPYQLQLTYDPGFSLVSAPGFASRTEHTLRVTRQLTTDLSLPLEFSRQ